MFEKVADLSGLVKLLAQSGARIDGDHVLTESHAAKIRSEIGKLISDEAVSANVRTVCRYKNCVNPEHMLVRFEKRKNLSKEKIEEIEALSSDLDFDKIKEIGASKYAEEYNEGMPEELKVTSSMIRQCVKYEAAKRSKELTNRKNVLNIRQFAKRIGLSPEWVSRLVSKGKITPRIRGCGQRYFLDSDVDDWLSGRESPLFKREDNQNG